MRYSTDIMRWLFIIGCVLCALTHNAFAQDKKSDSGVIRLEETVIEGRVQKPNAFFIATRQALVYEIIEMKESFVGEITRSVKQGPF